MTLDHVDRIVAEVQALSHDQQSNADVIRRIRQAAPTRAVIAPPHEVAPGAT